MPDDTAAPEDRRATYSQLCDNYRAIDDVRTKLLGLLPVATGAGIFLVIGKDPTTLLALSAPAGTFGLLITLGLFSYELHGIKKCGYLIAAGAKLETDMKVCGPFQRRPHEVGGLIDETFAASVIYSASLAGWLFLLVLNLSIAVAISASAAAFLLSALYSQHLIRSMETDLRRGKVYEKEPWLRKLPKGQKRLEDIKEDAAKPAPECAAKPASNEPIER